MKITFGQIQRRIIISGSRIFLLIKFRSILLLIIGTLFLTQGMPAQNYFYYDDTMLDDPKEIASRRPPTQPVTQQTPLPLSENTEESQWIEATAVPTPTPTATPDPFSDLYECQMSVKFLNGPFEARTMDFEVLGKDYFTDKADKFSPGKGTGVYYEAQRYFILHSSFVNGNILKPMEAEFFRRYLEAWGGTDNNYIQGNIDNVIGSEALWICDGKLVFKSTITGITRLSYVASQDLWRNPQNLESILEKREGLSSEWIGELNRTDDPSILIGSCGWGPDDSNERFSYYRYLINFKIIR